MPFLMVNAVKDTRKLKPQLTKKLSFSGSGTMKDWWSSIAQLYMKLHLKALAIGKTTLKVSHLSLPTSDLHCFPDISIELM